MPSLSVLDLARSLRLDDAFGASAWLHEAADSSLDWSTVSMPERVPPDEAAVAAALVEIMAERMGVQAPAWTREVGATSKPLFIPPSLEHMPRARARAARECPEPARRRGILMLEDVLTIA